MAAQSELPMPKTPYHQQRDARQQNASALLRDLWHHGPLSKAMLAQRNGLTKATVSAICRDLAAMGLIREIGQDRSGIGRPGQLLELIPNARCAIGVEISTNYVAAVLTDLCGEPIWQRAVLFPMASRRQFVIARTEELLGEAIDKANADGLSLLGIGVGVPGVVGPGDESLVNSPALGWKEVELKRLWETRFSLPVVIDNKARTAAMAESLNGSARDVSNFVYVSLGTDVQSSVEAAVITDNSPLRGVRGMAVDAGHMILDPAGPLCSCGQRGCWEAMVDVDREAGLVRGRLAKGEASVLRQYAEDEAGLEHRIIHQAAVEGDRLALEVSSAVIMNNVHGIINLVRLFDPELVVIGFANTALPITYKARMQYMIGLAAFDIRGAVRERLAGRGVTPPAVTYAAHGPEACMLGAAALLVADFLRTPPASGD